MIKVMLKNIKIKIRLIFNSTDLSKFLNYSKFSYPLELSNQSNNKDKL